MRQPSRQRTNQQGLVSIIVTLIIMAVLSLIVIGFAQLARQEQRRSLDRQLSTQAQFAAESGINSARNAIKGAFTGDLTDCSAYNALSAADKAKFGALDLNDNTKVTCLLLKQGQIELLYGNVSTEQSQSIPLNVTAPDNITSLTIKWKPTNGTATPVDYSDKKLTPASSWPSPGLGMIRIELVPLGGFDRAGLLSGRRVLFAYPDPTDESNTIDYASINSSTPIIGGKCGASGADCQVKITGLSGTKYFLRVRSIYRSSNLTVCVNDCASTELRNAQVSVDATGKAQDVIKRINARIPAKPETGDLFPEYVLESIDSVCKRLTVMPDVTDITQTPPQTVNKSQNDCGPADTN